MNDTPQLRYPAPPRLHWIIFLLALLCLVAFDTAVRTKLSAPWISSIGLAPLGVSVWEIHQAIFVREIDSLSSGLWMTGVGTLFGLLGRATTNLWAPHSPYWMCELIGFAFIVGAQFNMRRSLETHYNSVEPYHLKMGGGWLLILGTFYIQYHLRKIAIWKDKQP